MSHLSSRPDRSPGLVPLVRTAGLSALVVAGVVATAALAAQPAAAAGGKLTVSGGYAYGTTGHLGSYARSGRSALTTLCTSKGGVKRTNHTGATSIPNVGTVGAVTTHMSSARPSSGPVSTATTKTSGFTLFGVIKASAVTSTARVARTANGIKRTGSTGFVGLSIAGHKSPPAHPSVNQKMSIPGIGTIVFNQHKLSRSFGSYRITVIAMTLTVPKNNVAHLPAGRLVIGRGGASLHTPTFANPHGYAFGTSMHVANQGSSNRTSAVYLGCGGTGGGLQHNRADHTTVPNALTAGADSSSATSHDTATATVVHTANATTNLRLFGGVIKASSVQVSAQTTRTGAGVVHRATTSKIGGFTVNGQHRSGSAPANTKMTIPNLGTLWVHRVIKTPTGVTVRGLDLVLSVTKNGLKRGTELIIGAAHAAVSAR